MIYSLFNFKLFEKEIFVTLAIMIKIFLLAIHIDQSKILLFRIIKYFEIDKNNYKTKYF